MQLLYQVQGHGMKVLIKTTRVPGLTDGENRLIICSLVLTYYQRVTDRRTDRQTACSYVALWHSWVRRPTDWKRFVMASSSRQCIDLLSLWHPTLWFTALKHIEIGLWPVMSSDMTSVRQSSSLDSFKRNLETLLITDHLATASSASDSTLST